MGSLIRREYEEVIHVNDKPFFSDYVSKGVIHEVLEYGRGVIETEEHNSGFE